MAACVPSSSTPKTTGIDPLNGDRIIEIAALELMRDLPTGRVFHCVIDPERDVPEEASRIHGFTRADLMGKPKFAEIIDGFIEFAGDCKLVAHNAVFDFGFMNAELARLRLPALQSGPDGRHAGDCAGAVSGIAEQPGCAVPALRYRSVRAYDA